MSDRDPQDPVNPDPVPRDPITPGAATPPVTSTPTSTTGPASGDYATRPPTDETAKPDLGKRAIAAIVDGAIAGAVGLIPVIGGIIGALYILLRDGFDFEFMDGRSVGKKLMNLRPVRLDGGKMDFATSAKRNWTICLGSLASFLLVIPFLGWVLYIPTLIAAIVLGIIELVRVFTDPEGRRLGDTVAGTRVIEVAE